MKKYIYIILGILVINCGYFSSKLIQFNDLPVPDGPYLVGSKLFYWIDESRKEWYIDKYTDKRKLMVQVWYPAIYEKNNIKMHYIERMDERIQYIAKELEVPEFLLKNIAHIQSNSLFDAESIDGIFPIILFSHGLGGMRTQNTIQAEALASRGYVVVSTDHMYDANISLYPDNFFARNISQTGDLTDEEWYIIRNKQLEYRVGDISYLIDKLFEINNGDIKSRLRNKLDLNKIGIFGHSFGGATSVLAAINDDRIDACLTFDAWFVPLREEVLLRNFNKPFLHIGQRGWENKLNYNKLDLFTKNCTNDNYKFIIEDSKHFDFTDIPHFSSLTEKLKISGEIDKNILLNILNNITIDFFDHYIKNSTFFYPLEISKKYKKLILLESKI